MIEQGEKMTDQVNLLDKTQEPTEEDFDALTESAIIKVRARAEIAEASFWNLIREQLDASCANISSQFNVEP